MKYPEFKCAMQNKYEQYWQEISFEASLVETHQVELEPATRFGEHAAQLKMAHQLLHSGVDEASKKDTRM